MGAVPANEGRRDPDADDDTVLLAESMVPTEYDVPKPSSPTVTAATNSKLTYHGLNVSCINLYYINAEKL